MATYSGTESLQKEGLGEFADYGFSLKKIGDHTLELYFKDKRIATYNRDKATIPIIREGCRNYLASIAGYK